MIVVKLLADDELERSSTVANRCMNRERSLRGPNGYARELGFDPAGLLRQHAAARSVARWLDLCCGSGQALIEAAQEFHRACLTNIEIVGVDLVGMFAPAPSDLPLRRVEASLSHWRPQGEFDLITCVHGLHYIGDKLALVGRAAAWLTPEGLFVANLDLANLHLPPLATKRQLAAELRRLGLEYDARRKLLRCDGERKLDIPWQYVGADLNAGPNYTGQPAVTSHYERG
jgi:SAM-dependent methyltransferase